MPGTDDYPQIEGPQTWEEAGSNLANAMRQLFDHLTPDFMNTPEQPDEPMEYTRNPAGRVNPGEWSMEGIVNELKSALVGKHNPLDSDDERFEKRADENRQEFESRGGYPTEGSQDLNEAQRFMGEQYYERAGLPPGGADQEEEESISLFGNLWKLFQTKLAHSGRIADTEGERIRLNEQKGGYLANTREGRRQAMADMDRGTSYEGTRYE